MAISNEKTLEMITQSINSVMNKEVCDKAASAGDNVTFDMIAKLVDEKMKKTDKVAAPVSRPDFYTVEDALNFDGKTMVELHQKYIAELEPVALNYKTIVKSEGAILTDADGNEYIDFLASIGVANVGYANEYIWKDLQKCFDSKCCAVNAFAYHSVASAFAHNMAMFSPGQKLTKLHTFTSGSEAVENAVKMVKLACRNNPKKTHILACDGAYHGMTTGAVSMMGNPELREHQSPLMDNVDHIPYGDLNAFRAAIQTGKYRAFFVETIQGEGGMHVAPAGYFKEVRALCDKYDTYLVADEIQCGCGRSGKLWAIEYEDIIPDCIIFAKGFSGSCVPVAGFIATEELFNTAYENAETFEFSAGTYQLNDFTCAAANSSLQYVLDNDLMQASIDKGEYLKKKMNEFAKQYPGIVKEVRGRGLMLGIEFYQVPKNLSGVMGDCYGTIIAGRMIDVEHVMTLQCTNDLNSLHIIPPLTITKEEIDRGLAGMGRAIEFASVLAKVVGKLPANLLK